MTPETTFLLVIIGMAIVSGPLYMRMLAHGARPGEWWRGRRAGGLVVGIGLLVPGLIAYLIGGVGGITLAWMLLVSAAFNLSIAATCHIALRKEEVRSEK
jgi:4-amino-4-deoxy-L-arabinose transferase-like glycosyltransferase